MYDLEFIYNYAKENLPKERFEHSIRVSHMALELSEKHDYKDEDKLKISSYLHDIAKFLEKGKLLKLLSEDGVFLNEDEKTNYSVFHGTASKIISRDVLNIKDDEILSAIENHVMGKESMSKLDKIIFLADFVEVGRTYKDVSYIREACFSDLNLGMKLSYDSTIKFLIDRNMYIHENTIKGRNFILKEISERDF